MTTRLLALALSAALLPLAAQAQYYYDDYDYGDYVYEDDYAPLTGDAGLDALLLSINTLFNDQPDYYAEQLVRETRAQPVVVHEYLVERRYAPADVYMIGELSQLSGKSFTDVARTYDANRGQGWGAVARQLGIKPGSAQFHQLKNGGTTFVQRGKARGNEARVVRTSNPVDAHPGRGHGKDKAKSGKGQGKGKGKGKDK